MTTISKAPATMRTVRVTQNADSDVSFVAAPQANLRYVYFRSSDSVANQIEGQDYLVFKYNDRRLAFAVCDGVGSSYCGNIAAQVLGEGLLEWLWGVEADYLTSRAALSEAAGSFLRSLQPQAQREVEAYQIPDHLPALLQQALVQQRSYGSETVFVGGRLDHPSPELPDGRLMLVWMGDTQARLFDDAGDEINLDANWSVNDRWSSEVGIKGTVHAWIGDAQEVARLLIFTDGISVHANRLAVFGDVELEEAVQTQFRTANSDDVALLDIVRHTPVYLGSSEDEQTGKANVVAPQPTPIDNGKRANKYQLAWTWDGGRAQFEVQEATNPAFVNASIHRVGDAMTWQTDKARKPGRYYYRVRALNGRKALPGPWSTLQTARVAYPPPAAPAIEPVGPTPLQGVYPVVWAEVENAQDYVLEEATRSDFSDAMPVYRGRGNIWHAGPTREPMTYYYRVQASNDGGSSNWSATQEVAVIVPPPPVPSLAFISQVPAASPFVLSWSDVAQATHFEVQELDEGTGEETVFRTEDNRLPMDVHPTGRYDYRVRACHEHGCSAWSNAQTAEVLPEPPQVAPQLTAEGPSASHMLLLIWSEVAEATDYVLEQSDKPNFKRSMPFDVAQRTQHSLLRREPGNYFYRVRGDNISGFGPWSESLEVTILPGKPAWIDVTPSDDDSQRVEVAWEPVAGQVAYELEVLVGKADPDSGEWTQAKNIYKGTEPLCAARLPKNIKTIELRVRAVHPDGEGKWQYSEQIEKHELFAPPTLQPSMPSKSGTSIKISWSEVEGAAQYELQQANDESFREVERHVVSLPSHEIIFPADGPPGSIYLRVQAARADGQVSKWSEVITVDVDKRKFMDNK